jgi:hypothetical protein
VVVVILVDFSDCGGEISVLERVVKCLGRVGEVGLGGVGDARLKQAGQARTSYLTVIGNAECANESCPRGAKIILVRLNAEDKLRR